MGKKKMEDPFENFHAARVMNPELFEKESFRTKAVGTSGVSIIVGRLKGKTTTTTQAYRFPKEKFTVAQAKAWLRENKVKSMLFEPAKKNSDEDNEMEDIYDIEEDIKNNSTFFLDAFDETKLLLTEKTTKTPEGFLKTQAIVTNTGIFNYITQDGTISRQLRTPEEVFNPDSLNSLKNIPITMGHPKELVNADNMKELQKKGTIIGFTGSNVRRNGHAASVDLTITDKKAIDSIESGDLRALSCGYLANTDFSEQGFAFGNNRFNAQQKDIHYNHVALVGRGRAGDLAQIRIDNDDLYKIADNIAIQYIENDIKEDKNMSSENKNTAANDNIITTTLKIDGVDRVLDIDKDVAKHINTLVDENKALQTKLSDAEGKRDAFKDEVDKLKKESGENKLDEAEIQKRVMERTELVKIADQLKVEYKSDTLNKDLKVAIIKKKSEKADITGKDDAYIDAYFDSVKDMIVNDTEGENEKENKKKVFGKNQDSEKKVLTKDEMYEQYKKKIVQDSQNYQGGATIVDGKVIIK